MFDCVTLEELCETECGITYGIVKVGDFVPNGVPVIRGGDIKNGRIKFDDHKRVSKEKSLEFSRTILQGGEIVMNLISEPGLCAIVPSSHCGSNVSRDVAVIRLREGIETRYIYYFLISNECVNWHYARLQGSVTQKINLGTLRETPIFLPELQEQKRISAILGALDDKIENNHKMNETLEAMAQAIFKSWFVDFDPVIDNALRAGNPIPSDLEDKAARRREVMARDDYKKQPYADLFPDQFMDSDLRPGPVGWKISSLDKVAHFLNGAACQNYPVPENGRSLQVLKIRELRSGCFSESTDLATADIPEKWIVDDGDVIFSWSASLLVKIWCGGKGALNQHLFKVTSRHFDKWFYYLWSKHHLDQFIRIAESKATTMGHIKRSHLSEALCFVPKEEVLNLGKSLLGPILEKAILNEIESRTLASLRDTLLPKLISGELRVPEIEGLVEEAL